MGRLIGVVGQIGSGKDVITKYIIEELYPDLNFENKKFAEPLKCLIANLLGVDRAKLEDRDFKDAWLPDFDTTLIVYKEASQTHYRSKVFMSGLCALGDDYLLELLPSGSEIVSKENIKATPRLLMQTIGTNLFRGNLSSDFWVQMLFKDFNENSNWVISDGRYPLDENLVTRLKGGVLIGVKRRFDLRYPEYAYLIDESKPYETPQSLKSINPDLYKTLMFESEIVMNDINYCDIVIENNGTVDDLKDKVKNFLQ